MVRSTSGPERYLRLVFSSFLASKVSADAWGRLSAFMLLRVQRRTRSCSCSRSGPCRQRRIKFMARVLSGDVRASTRCQNCNCRVAGQFSAARPAQRPLENQTVWEGRQLDGRAGLQAGRRDGVTEETVQSKKCKVQSTTGAVSDGGLCSCEEETGWSARRL